jgi:hypothetical protein
MHAIDSAFRSLTDEPAFQLCATVRGVEFWIPLQRGHQLRCVITDAALKDHYGADDDDPASWLGAFERHRGEIEHRALAASARRDDVHVVIVTDSEGKLTVSAGRCRT